MALPPEPSEHHTCETGVTMFPSEFSSEDKLRYCMYITQNSWAHNTKAI